RRADVEVQLAVGAHRQVLPEVAGLAVRIDVLDHDLARARTVELVLDAVVARDLAALGDEERALPEDDAVGRILSGEDRLHLALAALADHRVDVLGVAVADEQRAL